MTTYRWAGKGSGKGAGMAYFSWVCLLMIFPGFMEGLWAQPVPSDDEKIPFVCTFGKGADKKWGDDDCNQIFFFSIPESRKTPFYIRLFDPELSGKHDELHGPNDTKTKFSFYGGKGCHSNPDARQQNPKGNYKSGVLLSSQTFGADAGTDDKWYTLGPFNPTEGELLPDFGGYVFKLIVEGIEGNDGNLYRMFLSSQKEENVKVEGGKSFCYEYTFRLSDEVGYVTHIYPFLPQNVVSVEINIFDYDNEGVIRSVTVAKKGEISHSDTEGSWSKVTLPIVKEEQNTSMDIQFIKKEAIKNNNVAVYITNQFGELLPFYTIPIGGAPKYKYKINVQKNK